MMYLPTAQAAWPAKLAKAAADEGWQLESVLYGLPPAGASTYEELEVTRTDDAHAFTTDAEATSYVVQRALHGSLSHALAVYLEGRDPDRALWLPDELADLLR